MSIDVGWGQDDRAYLLIEFHAEWAWSDYYAALTQAHKLLESAIQKTPVIVDFSETLHFPRGVLTHFPAAMKYDHHNRGMMYIVGANSVLIAIGRMLAHIYPTATKSTCSLPTRAVAAQQVMQSQAK